MEPTRDKRGAYGLQMNASFWGGSGLRGAPAPKFLPPKGHEDPYRLARAAGYAMALWTMSALGKPVKKP